MLPTRMWPLAVLALTEPCECSTSMSPFAALTRRSPPTSPIRVSPLEFLITAEPSISPARTSPVAVASSASPVTRSSLMSPAVASFTRAARSRLISPALLFSSQRPSEPVQRNPPAAVWPLRSEPAGSSMSTSIEPPSLNGLHSRSRRGPLTSSLPSAYSTRVCSAAVTSSRLDESLGRTWTIVSARSPAATRTSATRNSSTTEIGCGVSK